MESRREEGESHTKTMATGSGLTFKKKTGAKGEWANEGEFRSQIEKEGKKTTSGRERSGRSGQQCPMGIKE